MTRGRTALQHAISRIASFYPFTIAGSLLFVLGAVLLARSFLLRDPYELVLSTIALFVLAVLALLGRMQAAQFSRLHPQWDTSIPLLARLPGESQEPAELQRLSGITMKPFLWFRVHFLVRGRVTVGQKAGLRISHEISTAGEEAIPLGLSIPFSGVLDARGLLSIGDIFGLTRSRFGQPIRRRLSVEPAVFPDEITIRVEAAEKSEEKQSQLNSDEDKYYMREYAPGDRFRDINWKTSSRLHQLFTRIAPVALEQTKLIAVEFRNYREAGKETLDSVTHLSYLKSWLISFLRTVKEANPDFRFAVTSGHGVRQIGTTDELASFSEELAGIFYQGDPGIVEVPSDTDELFIFTTPYDRMLPALLPQYPQRTINIIRILGGEWRGGAQRRQLPLFQPTGNLDLPGAWALRRDRKLRQPGIEQPGVQVVGEQVIEARLA